MQLVPGRGNPLLVTKALGQAGTARIIVSTTIPLIGVPVVTTTPRLSCPFTSVSASQFEMSCQVSQPDTPDGLVTITVAVVGANRNPGVLDLTNVVNLVVDLTPPPPPDTQTPGRIRYRRVPWGMESTGGLPQFSVTGLAGAVRDATVVRIVTERGERGRGSLVAGGAFSSIVLDPIDAPTVNIVAVDSAGNESAPVPVREIEWIATMSGKRAGSNAENPHAMEWVRARGDALTRQDATEAGAPQGIDRRDGGTLRVEGGASWQQRTFLWPAVAEPSFAYDSARGRLVRFGGSTTSGFTGNVASGDLMEWNGTDWFSRFGVGVDGTPAPRRRSAMAYDERNREVVVFGGRDTSALADTWRWDGARWRRGPAGPSPRSEAALFPDVRNGRLILVGGRDDTGAALADVWALTDERWVQLDAGVLPARAGAAVATDPTTNRTWLFGGESNEGLLADTWLFDGEQFTRLTLSRQPPARSAASMAYDSRAQTLVLLGGAADGGALRDVWTIDGGAWVSRGATPPLPRGLPTFFADTVRSRLMLMPGGDAGVYRWTGAGLVQEFGRADPPSAQGRLLMARQATTFGQQGFVTLLAPEAGGPPDSGILPFQRPLHLTANGWEPIPSIPGLSLPAPSYTPIQSVSFDYGKNELVLVSQQRASSTPDVFRWVNLLFGWRQPALDAGLPSMLSLVNGTTALSDRGPAVAAANGGPLTMVSPGVDVGFELGCPVVRPDGGGGSTIYQLGAQGWGERARTAENLTFPSAVSLPDGGAVFTGVSLPGPDGGVPRAVAYRWSGDALTALPDTIIGGALSMCWDEWHESVLAFGGLNAELNAPAVVYELAGNEWKPLFVADPEGDGNIPPRIGGAFAFDPSTGANVVFGGLSYVFPECSIPTFTPLSDTWLLHLGSQRPAVRFRVSVAAARMPAGFVPTQMSLEVAAAGHGIRNASPVDGYVVESWRGGQWALEDEVVTPANVVQASTTRVEEAPRLEQLLRGQRELFFQLSPRGSNGRSRAWLDLDYAELKLTYRLP